MKGFCPPQISAVSETGKPMLVGNLLLVSADGGEGFKFLPPMTSITSFSSTNRICYA